MSSDLASLPAGRQKTVGLHQGAKSLIRNVIRHTDTHNRLLEESEMWQTYYRLKKEKPDEPDKTTTAEKSTSDDKGTGLREPDIRNSFLYDDRKDMKWEGSSRRGVKKAHMDDIWEARETDAGSSQSTYWMRQLQKTEDKDPERWGHTGFKELYPEAFDSDRSAASDGTRKKKSLKKTHSRREHKHKSSVKKKKRRRSESDKVKKKKKKKPKKHKDDSVREKRSKKRRHSNDSDDHSSSDNHEKDRKIKKRRDSTDTSDSDSEGDEDSKRKKSRRNMKTESEREKKELAETIAHRSHKRNKKRKR